MSIATEAKGYAKGHRGGLGDGSRARVGARSSASPAPSSSSISTTPHPERGVSFGTKGEGLIELLTDRQVSDRKAAVLVGRFDEQRIRDAIAAHGEQSGVGAGLLVRFIERGEKPKRPVAKPRDDMSSRWEQFSTWCAVQIPEVADEMTTSVFAWWFRNGQPRPDTFDLTTDATNLGRFVAHSTGARS